mmetsp:Transcript_45476/g.126135  ORF Transcript_45476/g.126135 Transcript_45476/m.126135 type:complete len:245 (+) Transcript_45476:1568-2302(+)
MGPSRLRARVHAARAAGAPRHARLRLHRQRPDPQPRAGCDGGGRGGAGGRGARDARAADQLGERTGVGAAAEWRHRLVCAAHRPAGGPVHRAAGSAAHQQRRSGRRAGLRRCGAGVRVGGVQQLHAVAGGPSHRIDGRPDGREGRGSPRPHQLPRIAPTARGGRQRGARQASGRGDGARGGRSRGAAADAVDEDCRLHARCARRVARCVLGGDREFGEHRRRALGDAGGWSRVRIPVQHQRPQH